MTIEVIDEKRKIKITRFFCWYSVECSWADSHASSLKNTNVSETDCVSTAIRHQKHDDGYEDGYGEASVRIFR